MTDNSKPANQPEEKHWLDQFKEAWFRDNNILPIKELNEYWKDTERHAYMAYQYIRRYVLNAAHRADEGDREYATQLKEEIERLREFVKMVAGFHPDDNPIKLIQAAEALSTKQKGETND